MGELIENEPESPWKFGIGAIGEKEGLWISVDTTKGFLPIMEAFRTWEDLGVTPIENA